MLPPTEPSAIELVISGPIGRGDHSALCRRFGALLEGTDADLVDCDVGALVDPDAVTVDALARLQLTARQSGRRVRLRHACDELRELLSLMGLSAVLPLCPGLPLEAGRQPEEREEGRGVEKEADAGDPAGRHLENL